MKNKILIIISIAVLNNKLNAQWLTQSAEGKGSLLFKGSDISFDLAKTSISFGLNNLHPPVKLSNRKKDNSFLFYGASLAAKNEESIGNLFSKGDFVPASNLNAFIGIRFSNSFDSAHINSEARIRDTLDKIKEIQPHEFDSIMESYIKEILDSVSNQRKRKIVKEDWLTALHKNQNPRRFLTYIEGYLFCEEDCMDFLIKTMIKKKIFELDSINQKKMEPFENSLINLQEEISNTNLWKLSFFLIGGGDALSFKRFENADTSNLANSFIKEEYRGGSIGGGINYQNGPWKIGATYLYKSTNNFNLLDNMDYTLSSNNTSHGQTLSQQKVITAYLGKYAVVDINELNTDITYKFRLDQDAKNYAMLNAYLRGTFFSRDQDILPNTYNIGIAGYFFSKGSNFLGGLYVELPDVENNIERRKPVADQNIRKEFNRLTFGIIGKFSLSSLISTQ